MENYHKYFKINSTHSNTTINILYDKNDNIKLIVLTIDIFFKN